MLFPEQPEALETLWLTQVLRRANLLGEAAVVGFRCERSGLSEALATRIVRLRLSYDFPEQGAPRTVIAKFATAESGVRGLVDSLGSYAREVHFYRELAPTAGLPTPHCFVAELSPASSAFVLLLEDLAPAAPAPPNTGLSAAQAELAVRALARFHAAWWNRKELDGFRWLWPSRELFSTLVERFSSALAKCRVDLELRWPHLARAASVLADSVRGGIPDSLEVRPPVTLVHGDFHVSNLLFPNPAGRFAVVDWQTVRVAESGATDLARLLVSGLSPELRRAEQGRLLGIYQETLGVHGVLDFGMAELRKHYRRALFDQVLGQVILTATLERPSELLRIQGQRIDAALADAELEPSEEST